MDQKIFVTVDVVLLTLDGKELRVVVVQRDRDPWKGQLALPGGYVHPEEDLDSAAAAARVLLEKTGVVAPYLEQLYTFSDGARDPRGWSASIVYYALVAHDALQGQRDTQYRLVSVDSLPPLAFDHQRIVSFAVERVRSKASYSSLPCYLLPDAFTLAELQSVYERLLGDQFDKSSFRRKLADLDFLEPVKDAMRTGTHRPAQLYRLRSGKRPMLFNKTI
jgi:8-oxo-dGTP diphosphatase